MMFDKKELEKIALALDSLGQLFVALADEHPEVRALSAELNSSLDELADLSTKVKAALKDMGADPHRGKLATVQAEPDPDTDWIGNDDNDLQDLIDQKLITKSNTLESMKELMRSLVKQRDAVMKRLEGLKDVDAIARENERLKLELQMMGPVDAKEEIEILTRKIAAVTGERDVLKRQIGSLKTALRAERIERMVDEQIKPDVDPTLPELPAATRPCPHKFDYTKCDICADPPRLPAGDNDD